MPNFLKQKPKTSNIYPYLDSHPLPLQIPGNLVFNNPYNLGLESAQWDERTHYTWGNLVTPEHRVWSKQLGTNRYGPQTKTVLTG